MLCPRGSGVLPIGSPGCPGSPEEPLPPGSGRGQLPGQGLLPKELNLHPCLTVASWCGAAQGYCLGIKIKPTIAASAQCRRALPEGNYRWPEMARSAHSPELGRSRVHTAAGSRCPPHLALPQAFRIRASQIPSSRALQYPICLPILEGVPWESG